MKIAKTNRISKWIKADKELLNKVCEEKFISSEKVLELTGFKCGDKNKLVEHDGMVYSIVLNKVGNIAEIYPLAETFEKKVASISEHEDKETDTYSDAGGYLINGLLFSNGYGDGYNRVIIRKFTKETTHYTSRAEIFERANCQIVSTPNGVKVWKHDCADINSPAEINEPNAFKIVVHKRTLYIMVKGW